MKIYVFFADGFEDIEALAFVDVCRRANLDTVTVSVNGSDVVESAHGVRVVADQKFEDCDFGDATLLYLPGGMPGATNLDGHEGLRELIRWQYERGGLLAAICAAPLVYGNMGLLKGVKATCYPGFEDFLVGAEPTGELVVRDGQFFFGKGPGAALPLSYEIVGDLCGEATAEAIKTGMIFKD